MRTENTEEISNLKSEIKLEILKKLKSSKLTKMDSLLKAAQIISYLSAK